MYVFGYGSLMVDGWEHKFSGMKHAGATLRNYRRSFNKSSTSNWGTRSKPCPTLGLEPKEGAECIGCVLEFADSSKSDVMTYLRGREGKSFSFEIVEVMLADGSEISAVTSVNDLSAKSYMGDLSVAERQALVRDAEGKSGPCIEYVQQVRQTLKEMGVIDNEVEAFVDGLKTN
ncbi:gamma-glutamylcyclotransferase [Pseudomonadota bacterium]